MLRSRGVLTSPAASPTARADWRTGGLADSSVNVMQDPRTTPPSARPPDRPSITAFPGGSHSRGLRPRQVGEPERPEARLLALLLAAQRLEDLFRGDRHFVDADADGVVHRVRDGGRHGEERALPALLRAEGANGAGALDDVSDHVAHLERGGALVLDPARG